MGTSREQRPRHQAEEASATVETARQAFVDRDYERCAAQCEAILRRSPEDGPALHLLGVAWVRLGHHQEGADMLAKALEQMPTEMALRFDRATALVGLKDIAGAIAVLADGARYHPGDPVLAARLARQLAAAELHDGARQVLRAGIGAAPLDAELRLLLGGDYAADLRFDQALDELGRAAELAPQRADIAANIGYVLQAKGDLAGAIAQYDRALTLAPEMGRAHMNRATALLTQGDFVGGFREFEWRLDLPENRRDASRLPRWQGEPLAGRRLLVTAEQGYGDMIQYARFLPRLTACGGEVVLECAEPLRRLLAGLPGVARTVALDQGDGEADLAVPLLSVPMVLGADAPLAETVPYLRAPDAEPFLPPLARGLKVGLVWKGRRGRGDVYTRRALNRRSCPPEALVPLLAVPGVAFYALQVEDNQTADEPPAIALPVPSLASALPDFAATAAAMASLDLIISVDTAAVHLAGALGRPVWVMLAPGQFDYRWGTAGTTSAWYPTARLFRGDRWTAVVAAVADALGDWAGCGGECHPQAPRPGVY